MGTVPERTYEILVAGGLDSRWSNWFESLEIAASGTDPALTVLRGVLDQSALRGVLNRVWDLNLALISVTSQVVTGTGEVEGENDD